MKQETYQKLIVTLLAIASLIAMAVYVFGNKNFDKFKRIENDVEHLSNLNQKLIDDRNALTHQIKGFHFDKRFFEHIAWEELDLIREGDQVFRFPKDKSRLDDTSSR